MPNPQRDTTAGRVFNDLRNKARREGRNTDELLIFYALERFLYRLSRSTFSDQLVLKGGLLLATFDARRATRDADLLAYLDGEQQYVLDCIGEITEIHVADGLAFDSDRAQARAIRETDTYAGIRITIPARLGKAQIKLALDISFSDPVTPAVQKIDYPQLLSEETFEIRGYPLETVLAEKITTMISLGDLNTRDRDWADVWRLTGHNDLDGALVSQALERTASHRKVDLRPLAEVIVNLPDRRNATYRVWRRKQTVDADIYPPSFAEVTAAVIAFTDPVLQAGARVEHWTCRDRSWS